MLRDPVLDFLPIPDPGAKKKPEAGPKRNRSPDPEHCGTRLRFGDFLLGRRLGGRLDILVSGQHVVKQVGGRRQLLCWRFFSLGSHLLGKTA